MNLKQKNDNYPSVKIGNQIWMTENLRVDKYRNGDQILEPDDMDTWFNTFQGAMMNFGEESCLYNGYALLDKRNIAPVGWRIPTDNDWKNLESYIGMHKKEIDNDDWSRGDKGDSLKRAGIGAWENSEGSNDYQFNLLPSGIIDFDSRDEYDPEADVFENECFTTILWALPEQNEKDSFIHYSRIFEDADEGIGRCLNKELRNGYSIRCIKDIGY